MLKRFCFVLVFILMIPMASFGSDCSAASAIVVDGDTMEILYSKDPYTERSIASTTKIMTSYIACKSGRLNEVVTVTKEMTDVIGTSIYLKVGDTITLYDLVVGMLLASGNDAANSVAIYLSGSIEDFAKLMNKTATEIGMKSSLFVTPSGLDSGNHHSTAYDMALLASTAMKDENFSKICSMKSAGITVSGKKETLYNHNRLLGTCDGCNGIKTGYTDKAGRCLVSSVKRGGNTLICVTLNDGSDWRDHRNLYDECFKQYKTYKIKNSVKINLVGAEIPEVSASYYAEYTSLDNKNIQIEIYHFPFIYAPVKKGEQVGWAIIKYKDKIIQTVVITAEKDVYYYGE